MNAMNAGMDIKLVAMADVFDDHLKGARERIKAEKPAQVDVPDEHVSSASTRTGSSSPAAWTSS